MALDGIYLYSLVKDLKKSIINSNYYQKLKNILTIVFSKHI